MFSLIQYVDDKIYDIVKSVNVKKRRSEFYARYKNYGNFKCVVLKVSGKYQLPFFTLQEDFILTIFKHWNIRSLLIIWSDCKVKTYV